MLSAEGKGKEDIIELLENIGRVLSRPVKAYILGGAALTLCDIKESTLDIDIIVEDPNSYEVLIKALQSLGFIREDRLRFRNPLTGEYIDIDMGKFIRLPLYKEFKEDAQLLGVFGNLTALLFSNESIILFKSVTEREKDIDDIAGVIKAGDINWDKLIEIAVSVTKRELGEKRSRGVILVYEVFVALERVNEKYPNLVSQNILKRIERTARRYYRLWLEHATRSNTHRGGYEDKS